MARILVASLALALALPAFARADSVASSMGDLRWGLSEMEVERFLKRKVQEAAREAGKQKGFGKHEAERRLAEQLRQIEHGVFAFGGGRSRWDSGPIGDQFTHGNQESVLVYDDGDSRNYYFFIQGRLWKWYKSYPSRAFGGTDFKRFSKLVEKKFGRGRVKEGELYAGTGEEHRFIEYMTRNTRLRAVDKTSEHGEYALVFEDIDTVRDLPALRTEADRRSRSRATARREREADDDEESATATRSTATRSPDKHKSVIAESEESRGETGAEYNARRKRVIAAEQKKEESIHDRQQDRKQGKALDTLAGIEDDDPLSGF